MRSSISKTLSISEKKLLQIISAALFFMTFAPLWKIGLTNSDDYFYMFADYSTILTFAETSGRFFLAFSGLLYKLPYLVNNWIYFHLITFSILFLMAHAIGKYVEFQTTEPVSQSFFFIIFCAFFQQYPGYYPTTAFYLVFIVPIMLFFMSLYFLKLGIIESSIKKIYVSAFVFFLAILPYETFVIIWTPCVLLFVIFYGELKGSLWKRLQERLVLVLPYALSVTVYVLLFLAGVFFAPETSYSTEHHKVNFDFAAVFSTWWKMGVHALPGFSFSYLPNEFMRSLFWGNPYDIDKTFLALITGLELRIYLATFIIFFTTVFLLNRVDIKKNRRQMLSLFCLGSWIFLMSPTLHAFNAKYQLLSIQGTQTYLPTFFSYVGMSVASTSIILYLMTLQINKVIKSTVVVMLALMISGGFVVNSISNQYVFKYHQYQNDLRNILIALADTSTFINSPVRPLIYTSGVQDNLFISDFNGGGDEYWESWISSKLNRHVKFTEKMNIHEGEKVSYLKIYRSLKTRNFLIVYAPSATLVNVSDGEKFINQGSVYVFTSAIDQFYHLFGSVYDEDSVQINNIDVKVGSGRYFHHLVNTARVDKNLFVTQLNGEFLLDSINISNLDVVSPIY